MAEWISVKDRLPGEDIQVLVTYIGFNKGDVRTDMIACISGGTWQYWECEPGGDVMVKITQWMPLPEPPKEE